MHADSSKPLSGPATTQPSGGLLALASSGAWTSVALLRDTPSGIECDSLAEPAGAGQSARLFALIDELLGGRSLDSIGAIAFTGLRIGCSVAQGIGFARGLPLVGIGSLEAAAWRGLRLSGLSAALVLVANDARMGEIYAAACSVRAPAGPQQGPAVDTLAGPVVCRPDAFPEVLAEAVQRAGTDPGFAGMVWLAAGDAWQTVGLPEAWHRPLAGRSWQGAAPGTAREIAELALPVWRAGGGVAAEEASPRYIRDKVALDVDEQQALRAQRLAAK